MVTLAYIPIGTWVVLGGVIKWTFARKVKRWPKLRLLGHSCNLKDTDCRHCFNLKEQIEEKQT